MATVNLIGRDAEQRVLGQVYDEPRAQLVAVYGRRRVGKTFLVKTFFARRMAFCFTGVYGATAKMQLGAFAGELGGCMGKKLATPKNWFEAFGLLRNYLESLPTERKVVFLDEMPWLDTPRSDFLAAFSFFWNNWAETQEGLKIIVCGSAASWMVEKLVGSKGGLYGRLSRTIYLRPFTLGETEQFLLSRGFVWNRDLILQTYMIFGGIPYYLSLLDPTLPFTENIDALFFRSESELRNEYHFLFQSLFTQSEFYQRIVEVLATKKKGMTLEDLREATKSGSGGRLSAALETLRRCEFVRIYYPYGKKKKGAIYQLIDPLCIFFHTFMKDRSAFDAHFWTRSNPAQRSVWAGYAFERVCLMHIDQIRRKLQILGVLVTVHSWAVKAHVDGNGIEWPGAQIDLILERADRIAELCEIKYTRDVFVIDREYEQLLRRRMEEFVALTQSKSMPRIVFITTEGVKENVHSGIVQGNVTADDLFAPPAP